MRAETSKVERTRAASPDAANKQIDKKILANLKSYRGNNTEINRRIAELDREWDIERTLQFNAAILVLTGTILSVVIHKRWSILPGIVAGFLGVHAIQGWCPPVPVFRAMGVRTRPEIDREKYALKALRGDFDDANTANKAWRAVNK